MEKYFKIVGYIITAIKSSTLLNIFNKVEDFTYCRKYSFFNKPLNVFNSFSIS